MEVESPEILDKFKAMGTNFLDSLDSLDSDVLNQDSSKLVKKKNIKLPTRRRDPMEINPVGIACKVGVGNGNGNGNPSPLWANVGYFENTSPEVLSLGVLQEGKPKRSGKAKGVTGKNQQSRRSAKTGVGAGTRKKTGKGTSKKSSKSSSKALPRNSSAEGLFTSEKTLSPRNTLGWKIVDRNPTMAKEPKIHMRAAWSYIFALLFASGSIGFLTFGLFIGKANYMPWGIGGLVLLFLSIISGIISYKSWKGALCPCCNQNLLAPPPPSKETFGRRFFVFFCKQTDILMGHRGILTIFPIFDIVGRGCFLCPRCYKTVAVKEYIL